MPIQTIPSGGVLTNDDLNAINSVISQVNAGTLGGNKIGFAATSTFTDVKGDAQYGTATVTIAGATPGTDVAICSIANQAASGINAGVGPSTLLQCQCAITAANTVTVWGWKNINGVYANPIFLGGTITVNVSVYR